MSRWGLKLFALCPYHYCIVKRSSPSIFEHIAKKRRIAHFADVLVILHVFDQFVFKFSNNILYDSFQKLIWKKGIIFNLKRKWNNKFDLFHCLPFWILNFHFSLISLRFTFKRLFLDIWVRIEAATDKDML